MRNLQPSESASNQTDSAAAAAVHDRSSGGIGFEHDDEPLQFDASSTVHVDSNEDSSSDCEGQFSWRQQLLRSPC